MRNFFFAGLFLFILLLVACGVPREAGTLAAATAAANTTIPATDDAVRQQLISQDAAWSNLAALLQRHEFGGITGVDQNFIHLVRETAAIAKRQHDLIDQQKDDPAFNRQSLDRFNHLWQSTTQYLNP